MILFTNGCSWTWGGGLDDHFHIEDQNLPNNCRRIYCPDLRIPIVWPGHLGKLLNASEVIDLSNGGGSNQRILRTTLDWLLRTPKDKLRQTVAIIQIAEFSRFEMYEKIHESENYSGDWLKCKIDSVGHESGYELYWHKKSETERENYLKIGMEQLARTHQLEDLYRNLSYMYALKGLFDSYNIKDFFIWYQSNNWETFVPEPFLTGIFNDFNVLDKNQVWSYESVSSEDAHPSLLGHKQIAKIIYDKIKHFEYG